MYNFSLSLRLFYVYSVYKFNDKILRNLRRKFLKEISLKLMAGKSETCLKNGTQSLLSFSLPFQEYPPDSVSDGHAVIIIVEINCGLLFRQRKQYNTHV